MKKFKLLKQEIYTRGSFDVSNFCRFLGVLAEKSINKTPNNKYGTILSLSAHQKHVKKNCQWINPNNKNDNWRQTFESSTGKKIKGRVKKCWKVVSPYIKFLNSIVYPQDHYSWFFVINEFRDQYRKNDDLVAIRGFFCEDILVNEREYINDYKKCLKETFGKMPTWVSATSYPSQRIEGTQTFEGLYNVQAIWLFNYPEKIEGHDKKKRANQLEYWQEYNHLLADNFGVNIGGSNLNQVYRFPGSQNHKHKEKWQVKQLFTKNLSDNPIIGIDKEGDYIYQGKPDPIIYHDSKKLRKWILIEQIRKRKMFTQNIITKLEKNIDYRTLENILCLKNSVKRFENDVSKLIGSVCLWLIKSGFSDNEIADIILSSPIQSQPRSKGGKNDSKMIEYTINKIRSNGESVPEDNPIETCSPMNENGKLPQVFMEFPKLFFQRDYVVSVKIEKKHCFERNSPYIVTKKMGLMLFCLISLADIDGEYQTDAKQFINTYFQGKESSFYDNIKKLSKITFTCSYYYQHDFDLKIKPVFDHMRRKEGIFAFQLSKAMLQLMDIKKRLKQWQLRHVICLNNTKGRYTIQLYFFCLFHLYHRKYRKSFDNMGDIFSYLGTDLSGVSKTSMRKYKQRLLDSINELNSLNILNYKVILDIKKCMLSKVY